MTSPNPNLAFRERTIGDFTIPTLDLGDERRSLCLHVSEKIANSGSSKPDLQSWKARIASEVKCKRGEQAWNRNAKFAISIDFRFNMANHRNQKLDLDNFVKPVIDAVAGGLFCDNETDLENIEKWKFPDHNFYTLLIHRLTDAPRRDGEGVAICVSASG